MTLFNTALGNRLTGLVWFFAALLSGCHNNPQTVVLQQSQLDKLANQTQLQVGVDSNINVPDCPGAPKNTQCYLAHINLTLPIDINTDQWAIYFSTNSPIQWDGSKDFDIQHINGDLHRLIPLNQHYQAGKTYRIDYKGPNWRVAETDFMPNYFLVADGLKPRTIKSTEVVLDKDSQLPHLPHVLAFIDDKQMRRTPDDDTPLATPQHMFQRDQLLNPAESNNPAQSNRIIPQLQTAQWQSQRLDLTAGINISQTDQQRFSAALAYLEQLGIKLNPQGTTIQFTQLDDAHLGQQGYQLHIDSNHIVISANQDSGLFYGLMSIAQLLDRHNLSLPVGHATDVPRYDFRGLHLDIARNFHSKKLIMAVLDQMARYKLNKLHLHLADDEGWRLQIPGLPELTDVGAYRCFDPSEQHCLLPMLGSGPDRNSPLNGYLTKDDYIDLLHYAQARHIEVIPAVDMPGHSRAAIKAMQARYNRYIDSDPEKATRYLLSEAADKSHYSSIQYYNDNTLNPCLPSTYRFIAKVFDAIKQMHQQAGVPLRHYHIGADETAGAWTDSPACQGLIHTTTELQSSQDLPGYFIAKVTHMIAAEGVEPAAWSDGLAHVDRARLPEHIQANIWDSLFWHGYNRAQQVANQHFDAVLSLPGMLYFDFPYQADPLEPGYYWGSRYTDSYQVFQFMPDNLPVHAAIWPDRMGHSYTANPTINLQPGAHYQGLQAQLWSETVRSDNAAEYMLFPRLITFAERAWHKADWAVPYQPDISYSPASQVMTADRQAAMQSDWQGFSQTLVSKVLPDLQQSGVFFRLPPPGAEVTDGQLRADSYYPGLQIDYRLAEGKWQPYKQPVEVSGKVELRSRLPGMARSSRVITVQPDKNTN